MSTHTQQSSHAKLLTDKSRNFGTPGSVVGHHGDGMSVQKNTFEQMVFGKMQKRQVVAGQVTPKLNGQQTAHPGSGLLNHSAIVIIGTP